MIQLTPHMKIFIYLPVTDFRCGLDCLISMAERHIEENTFSGNLYLFKNRKSTCVKMIMYDGQGYWLFQKRLSSGKFKWWPKNSDEVKKIDAHALQVFLRNGDPENCFFGEDWRPLK